MDGDGNARGALTAWSAMSGSRTNDRNAMAGRRDASLVTNVTPSQRQPCATHSLIAVSSVSSVTIDSSTIL